MGYATYNTSDDQVLAPGRPPGVAGLLLPDQPPRLHPGPAVRRPGPEDLPQDRLPRRRRLPPRLRRAARRPGAVQGAPLLDLVLRGAAPPAKGGFRKLQRRAFRC